MQDIKDDSGTYPYSQLTKNVIRGLPPRSDAFVVNWELNEDDFEDSSETRYKRCRAQLLKFADNYKEKWEK